MTDSDNLYNQVMRRLREHEAGFRDAVETEDGAGGDLHGLDPAKIASALAAEDKFRDLHAFVTKYPEEAWMFGRAVRDRLAQDHDDISGAQKSAVLAALRKRLG